MTQKSRQVALDTNFLIDLADGNEDCLDCLRALRDSRVPVRILVTPTGIQELADIYENGETEEKRSLALTALQSLSAWGIGVFDATGVDHGIVQIIGDKIRAQGLLPASERHDSFIIAEAALAGCEVLISADHHLTAIDPKALGTLLEREHVTATLIYWPRKIVQVLGLR